MTYYAQRKSILNDTLQVVNKRYDILRKMKCLVWGRYIK